MPLRATLVALLFVVIPSVTPSSAATLPAEPERWLTDLRFPVNLAWAPDGTLFFAEKDLGNVRMVVDGAVLPEAVAHVDVDVSFETGLLGLAVHPRWPDEPWLYLYYSDPGDEINRLIRLRVEGGREVERETLLDGLPTAAAYHNGGDMLFGADGMLYLAVGDAHESQRAQDPADLGGKVLRITPNGEIPDDNPIPGTRTFTLGHRNSFGLCIDPATGDVWETENGPGGGDEVNHLVAGANYGWPEGTGPLGDERYTDPFMYFPDTIVPTGCAVWRDQLYVATYGDGHLLRSAIDGATSGRVFRFGQPAFDLAVGPDALLYAATGDTIWRFDAPPSFEAPLDAAPERGSPGWVVVSIGVILATSLIVTLRLAARRR
jgi:glucose/arabinose dehydrogenase